MHVRIVTSAVKLLWGDLEIVQSRLPKDMHGPVGALPGGRGLNGDGKQARASERPALRVAA